MTETLFAGRYVVVVTPRKGREYLGPDRECGWVFRLKRQACLEAEKKSHDDSVVRCRVVRDAHDVHGEDVVAVYEDGRLVRSRDLEGSDCGCGD